MYIVFNYITPELEVYGIEESIILILYIICEGNI